MLNINFPPDHDVKGKYVPVMNGERSVIVFIIP